MNLAICKNQKITQAGGKCLDKVHEYFANSYLFISFKNNKIHSINSHNFN